MNTLPTVTYEMHLNTELPIGLINLQGYVLAMEAEASNFSNMICAAMREVSNNSVPMSEDIHNWTMNRNGSMLAN